MRKLPPTAALLLGAALLWGAALPARADDGIFPPAPVAKASIDFDGRGFLINGKRTPLISAGLEYARIPRALWRDRLLRLQRGGFNCVEVYTFWNWHEPQEGKFDFKGDHDLDAFLKLVHQLGMYAICRVGPYYCAEWDGGGYPTWLRFKPGVQVRVDNAPFLAAVDRFFGRLIPVVAANQINRGGSVVLVQLENEHPAGWGREMPNAYFTHLRDKAVALGVEVPYFFSGLHHSSDPAGNRSWDSVGRTNPWLSTEYWSVWYDHYGANPEDADTYERRTWKVLAYGGNGYNFYMAHGGTNFGYTNNNEDASSYDYGAAVGQTGDLRPIYYRFKRIGWFARSFPELFANSVNADAAFQGIATDSAVRVTARRSPGGSVVFLDNPGKETVKTQIKGPDGQLFPASGPLTLPPGQIVPIVQGAPLTPHITLALGAARILGTSTRGGTTTLVVYGLPGDPGTLRLTAPSGAKTEGGAGAWASASGGVFDLNLTFPADRPAEYRLTAGTESIRILAMSDTLADHTWFVPDGAETAVVCGPAYVGEVSGSGPKLRLTVERGLSAPPRITPAPYAEESAPVLYGAGLVGTSLTAPLAPPPFTPPTLTGWESQAVTEAAPKYADGRWLSSPNPQPMGADGDGGAYAWYRTTVHVPAPGEYTLAFDSANDRLIPFVDGNRLTATNLRGSAITLPLTPGDHSVAILAVHYGRDKLFNFTGMLGTVDRKGLVGPARLRVSDGPGVPLTVWRMAPVTGAPGSTPPAADAPGWVDVKVGDDTFKGRRGFAWYQTTLPAAQGKGGGRQVLSFEGVDDNATVFLNGKEIGRHEGWNTSFTVPVDATGQPAVLTVLVQNTDGGGGIAHPVTLVSYLLDTPVTGWKMRGGIEAGLSRNAWKPFASGSTPDGSPRYYRARFTVVPPQAQGFHPVLRVVTGSLSAGFVWLNGHNLGRYPEKIPVNGMYLPECWLKPGENTLVIFDEDGKTPEGVSLTVETVASRTVTELTAR